MRQDDRRRRGDQEEDGRTSRGMERRAWHSALRGEANLRRVDTCNKRNESIFQLLMLLLRMAENDSTGSENAPLHGMVYALFIEDEPVLK